MSERCMKKPAFLLALLLVASVHAYTLANYPSFFVTGDRFKATYVIGEEAPALDVVSATVLSTALVRYPNLTTEIGTSRLDTEITDITAINAIVIGSPCENIAAARLEGNPQPCNKNLGGSVAYIKIFQHNGKVQLLITGITAEDRHQAAEFLAERNLDKLNLTEYTIPTTTNSTPFFFARNQTTKNTTNQTVHSVEKYIANTTNITVNLPPPTPQLAPPPPQPVGDYEPLYEMPKRKGFFARLWDWITHLF